MADPAAQASVSASTADSFARVALQRSRSRCAVSEAEPGSAEYVTIVTPASSLHQARPSRGIVQLHGGVVRSCRSSGRDYASAPRRRIASNLECLGATGGGSCAGANCHSVRARSRGASPTTPRGELREVCPRFRAQGPPDERLSGRSRLHERRPQFTNSSRTMTVNGDMGCPGEWSATRRGSTEPR